MANNKAFSLMDEIDDQLDIEMDDPNTLLTGEEVEEIPYEAPKPKKPVTSEKREWTPKVEALDEVPEMKQSSGVVYHKDDYVESRDTTLHNGAEEATIRGSTAAIDEIKRQDLNIKEALARHGILNLALVPGSELETRFRIAGSDTEYQNAQAALDELIEDIEKNHPALIARRTDEWIREHEGGLNNEKAPAAPDMIDVPDDAKTDAPTIKMTDKKDPENTTVVIDKKGATSVVWTDEELDKIRRSRTIELNIVDAKDLELGTIEDVDSSAIDSILSEYDRTVNDVSAALPASHYRATFTGLTYAEVIDLSTSHELNTFDAERKKLTICYNHIKNMSIGPWEEYIIYKDPVTKETVKAPIDYQPEGVDPEDIQTVTKFDDFLKKTSFLDIDFMLWKILCASTMNTELITIKCNKCDKSYEWGYNPSELLQLDEMDPAVLEDLKAVATADTKERIMELWKTGPVSNSNYVTLHSSKFKAIYGHCSAYTYLNEIYGLVKALEGEPDNPEIISKSWEYLMLPTIKGFLIPTANGYKRITGAENIIKVINTLDEIDFRTLSEISRIAREPYTIKFVIKDVKCPNCGDVSDVTIDSISSLVFIVARLLASVNVTLKSK